MSSGDLTRKLQKLAVDATATLTTPLTLAINVEGPYGLPSIDRGDGVYTVYLMISGGIGDPLILLIPPLTHPLSPTLLSPLPSPLGVRGMIKPLSYS